MTGRVFGLLGRHLSHSYSVPIHQELGNDAYRLYELEESTLASFFKREDLGGVNVTIPYKRTVMQYLDELSNEAREIGSVNTVVRKDGALKGYNTDVYGLRYMAARAGISFESQKALIFGSGGASLTAQYAAKADGAREVIVVSRTGANNYENISRHYDADILVNATPLGMYPNCGVSPTDLSLFKNCGGVLDLIYNPRRTALLLQAEQLGVPHSDGLPMLVAQAKAAEEIFFGRKIDDGENERIIKLIRQKTANIVLIGMPGCGKNAVGDALAAMTGRAIIDIDEEIEKAVGKTIPEIFEHSGEKEFRRLEREQTAKAGKESGKIIVTGGGIVKDERNYISLHQNGRIYHIVRDISLLPRDGRPLSKDADLNAMLKERLPLYERFRDAAAANDRTPKDAAEEIWRDYENSCD